MNAGQCLPRRFRHTSNGRDRPRLNQRQQNLRWGKRRYPRESCHEKHLWTHCERSWNPLRGNSRAVFNIETVDGWSWIGIFALACLYALIPLYFVRPAEFLMASSNWGESMAPAWLIWLGFVFDTASFVITAVLISGLIQLGRGKPHATHKLRLACLLFLTLYLVATVFGVMLRVEVLTGVSAEPDYLAGVDGLIEGFETLYAKLIICLGIPAVIFTWSRRLEGIELTDRSVV